MAKIRPPGIQPATLNSTIYWLTVEYVYNRSGYYNPSLEDMLRKVPVTSSDLFNTMPSYISIAEGGSLLEDKIPQYTHRLYSAYFFSKGKSKLPTIINWDGSITINNTYDGDTYTIYQDDRTLSKVRVRSNVDITLSDGLNRVDILLYTPTDNVPLSMNFNTDSLYYTYPPQILPRFAEGNIDLTISSASTSQLSKGASSGVNFFVRKATRSIDEISDEDTPGYSGEFSSVTIDIKGQSSSGYPDAADASSGTGFILEYSGVDSKTLRVLGRWMALGIGI